MFIAYSIFPRWRGILLVKMCKMSMFVADQELTQQHITQEQFFSSLESVSQDARFMGVDVIRMHLKKIPTLILLFNFYIYIILLLEIDNSIIIGLKIMNLNILLLNF